MAINRSTLFQWLEDSPHTFTNVICKRSGWYGSHAIHNDAERWNLYAVTDANEGAAEVAQPRGPTLTVGHTKTYAAAVALSKKLNRWIMEYYENV